MNTESERIVSLTGTVRITEREDVLLVPIPSVDPQDPLNLPRWRKAFLVILLSLSSSLGQALLGGLGALLAYYIPIYEDEGVNLSAIVTLVTFPILLMGVSNLFLVPLALTSGRRAVFLGSLLLTILSSMLCAFAKDFRWHLGGRMVLGFAIGNSQALPLLIIQDVAFLHEKSTFIMWQGTSSIIIGIILQLFVSPIAAAIDPWNWYNLCAGICVLIFLLALWGIPETKYKRSTEHLEPVHKCDGVTLDYERYKKRDMVSDLRLFAAQIEPQAGLRSIFEIVRLVMFPNVFWASCLNGVAVACNIATGTTFSSILTGPIYQWPASTVSYVSASDIFLTLVALPLLGYGSDRLILWLSRKNDGVHEPENRLLPLFFPLCVGILSMAIYGQAAAAPQDYHWMAIVCCKAGGDFCFIGANIAAITYLVEAYPDQAGSALVVVCAFRGVVSFGLAIKTQEFIDRVGYRACFGAYAGLLGVMGVFGVLVVIYGKKIRYMTSTWASKHSF